MPNYRCLIETFIDVTADSEEEANKLAAKELIKQLAQGQDKFICWESSDAGM